MELRWVWDRHELETPTCYAILWDIRTHHIYMYIHVCVCFCSPASPFRHGPTTLPLMAKVYCTFVLCMAMFGLLIPKCSKPQTKRAQKKTQKYVNNPQKPAKTRKSKQFAISLFFFMNKIRLLFWRAHQPKLSMLNTRNISEVKQKARILSTWWQKNNRLGLALSYLHVTMHAWLLPVGRYDETCVAEAQWYSNLSLLVWKGLFTFGWEHSILAGNFHNGPRVQ